MRLVLPENIYDTILSHAKNGLPDEACGLIAGSVSGDIKTVSVVYPLTNTDASPEHFSLHPKEQLDAIKDMRARGVAPLGNFHSHPASPSRPSAEDIRLAYDPAASYLIVSLMDMERPVLKAFHIENGAVTEEAIIKN
jgi:proteasome lid subunit RPN8/RPN11